jgi:hypothetical protein
MSLMGDIWEDPEVRAWADHVVTELTPMIRKSALTVSIVPEGPGDVKFAVELGLSIMLGKPLILALPAGRQVPEKLARIADEIVEIDGGGGVSPGDALRVQRAISRVLGEE